LAHDGFRVGGKNAAHEANLVKAGPATKI